MNITPPAFPREAHLLHCLVEDYVRYKQQNYPATAHQVLQLIKQTVDDVIEHPERFAIAAKNIAVVKVDYTVGDKAIEINPTYGPMGHIYDVVSIGEKGVEIKRKGKLMLVPPDSIMLHTRASEEDNRPATHE